MLLDGQARHLAAMLEQEIRNMGLALVRMAQRWAVRGEPSEHEWRSDAELYALHFDGYLALAAVVPPGTVRWTAQPPPELHRRRPPGGVRQWIDEAMRRCGPPGLALVTCGFRHSGGTVLAYRAPIVRGDTTVAGEIIGLLDLERVISENLDVVAESDMAFRLEAGGETIYQRGIDTPEHPFMPASPLKLSVPTPRWVLEVSAVESPFFRHLLASERAGLALGLVGAALTGALAFLYQQSRTKARALARSSERLSREVAERGRAERHLDREKRILEQVVVNAADGIGLGEIDPESHRIRFTLWNPQMEEITGYSREAINATGWQALLAPESDRAAIRHSVDQLLRGETERLRDADLAILRADGALRRLSVATSRLPGGNGHPQVLLVVRDVTERVSTHRQQLAALTAQRDLLVREVHHRVKNTLQGVGGMLRQHMERHPETRDTLREAVSQLNTIAAVHGLQSSATQPPLTLGGLVSAIADTVGRSLPGAPDRITLEGDNCPHRLVEREAVPLALVLNELLFNAVKHGDGMAVVRLRCGGSVVGITVINRATTPPSAIDLDGGEGLGTGLELVRSLLPREGARLAFDHEGETFIALLELTSPVLEEAGR